MLNCAVPLLDVLCSVCKHHECYKVKWLRPAMQWLIQTILCQWCGVQIPMEEYEQAISHLMLDHKFHCHVWCYNVPAAIVFFTLLLCVCLSVIPLIEAHFIYKNSTETGLEFVHGGIVWLCGLTIYMVIIHISKRKVRKHGHMVEFCGCVASPSTWSSFTSLKGR